MINKTFIFFPPEINKLLPCKVFEVFVHKWHGVITNEAASVALQMASFGFQARVFFLGLSAML